MFKLIKLEWKKNRIGKFVSKAIILTAILFIFVMAMAGELESGITVEMYGKSMICAAVDLFTNMSCIVFTGVMLAAFVVNAYEHKTINLMFSYPIRRRRILLSKILAVWIFNFFFLLLSKILLYTGLLLTKSFTRISEDSIQMGELSFWLNVIIGSAAMVSISYIALLVGLKMKSSKAAIVTAVIIMLFTQGNIGAYTLADSAPFYGLLLVLSFVSVYLSICDAETRDVL